MTLFRNKYLLYPVLFILVLFVLDKIFLLPEVRRNFMQPGGMAYYLQRDAQVEKFRKYMAGPKDGRKTILVFGDSRSFALGNESLNTIGRPDLNVYNFAGPQALPAYMAYMSERLLSGVNRPDYVMIGISPDAFNRNAGTFGSPNLNWGISHEFLKKHRDFIPERDFETYVSSRRYALAGIRFSLSELTRRLRGSFKKPDKKGARLLANMLGSMTEEQRKALDPKKLAQWKKLLIGASTRSLKHYNLEKSEQIFLLNYAQGAQYKFLGEADSKKLKADAERLGGIYFKHFVVSEEQVYFFRLFLERTRLAGVKTIVFWPQVNPYLKQLFEKEKSIQELWTRMEKMSHEYGALSVDLNQVPETHCDTFHDASHLNVACFPPVMKYLVKRLEE